MAVIKLEKIANKPSELSSPHIADFSISSSLIISNSQTLIVLKLATVSSKSIDYGTSNSF
jgi:hypothetical protein